MPRARRSARLVMAPPRLAGGAYPLLMRSLPLGGPCLRLSKPIGESESAAIKKNWKQGRGDRTKQTNKNHAAECAA